MDTELSVLMSILQNFGEDREIHLQKYSCRVMIKIDYGKNGCVKSYFEG